MKNIIAYSMEKLYKDLEEADKLFLSSGMKDMELYEKQLAEAARKAAAEHMAALYSDMDRMLCEDISRAEKYTIQRHDERQLLTTVGPVCFTHTLFRSRKDGTCHYLLDEWMELVTECRQSGLTDAAWCNEHGISPSCFYNAVTRLRKKACQIPDPVGKSNTLDLTSHKQDVVQIAIEPESSPAGLIPDNGNRPMHLDNSHTIEIEADGLLIRMSNEIKPLLLKMLMDTLKVSLC